MDEVGGVDYKSEILEMLIKGIRDSLANINIPNCLVIDIFYLFMQFLDAQLDGFPVAFLILIMKQFINLKGLRHITSQSIRLNVLQELSTVLKLIFSKTEEVPDTIQGFVVVEIVQEFVVSALRDVFEVVHVVVCLKRWLLYLLRAFFLVA